eukprot:1327981-Amorphochlora_amoeboformis.AAC.1
MGHPRDIIERKGQPQDTMASVREAERQRDPEALRLKGGTTTKFNKFLNYDEAVRAANCHQMLTDIMFYVFWVAFFTMSSECFGSLDFSCMGDWKGLDSGWLLVQRLEIEGETARAGVGDGGMEGNACGSGEVLVVFLYYDLNNFKLQGAA